MGTTGNVFAVAGRLDDPAHKRAFVSVEEAIRTPVEQSDEKLYIANQAITQERVLARQQELARGMDGPSQSNPKMSVCDSGRNCAPVAQPGSTPSGASGIVVKRCREVRLTPLAAASGSTTNGVSASAGAAAMRTTWRSSITTETAGA